MNQEEIRKIAQQYRKDDPGEPIVRTGNGDMDDFICPQCKEFIKSVDWYESEKFSFCPYCGIKLNWDNMYDDRYIVSDRNE